MSSSAVASFDNTDSNNAILTQLQALATQIKCMNARLASIEKSITKPVDDTDPEPIELDPERSILCQDLTAEEYNTLARRYNSTVRGGDKGLVQLRTARNKLVLGFPPTLGHLVFLDLHVQRMLEKAFGLPPHDTDALWTFIGANKASQRMYEYYSTGESLAEMRMETRFHREKDIAAAGAPTAATKRASAAHNAIARAKNAKSNSDLMPIHDDRNIPVFGWPRTLEMLVKPYRQWNVLYLLGEYGQSEKKEGCLERLIRFVGADEEEARNWMEGGYGEFSSYWLM